MMRDGNDSTELRIMLVMAILAMIAMFMNGCVTPGAVVKGGEMQQAALITLEANVVETAIPKLYDMVAETTAQGVWAAFDLKKEGLIDQNGRVDMAQYEALMQSHLDRIRENTEWLDADREAALETISKQFAVVRALGQAQIEYNKSKKLTPESLDRLVGAVSGAIEDYSSLRSQRAGGEKHGFDVRNFLLDTLVVGRGPVE